MKKLLTILAFAPAFSMAATYEVPVEARLKPVATFNIKTPDILEYDGHSELTYHLPPELVGENFPPITLEGKGGGKGHTRKFASKQGEAFCLQAKDSLTCNLQMKNLNIDPKAVQDFVLKNSATPEEASLRLEVAGRFAGDPVGILKY